MFVWSPFMFLAFSCLLGPRVNAQNADARNHFSIAWAACVSIRGSQTAFLEKDVQLNCRFCSKLFKVVFMHDRSLRLQASSTNALKQTERHLQTLDFWNSQSLAPVTYASLASLVLSWWHLTLTCRAPGLPECSPWPPWPPL